MEREVTAPEKRLAEPVLEHAVYRCSRGHESLHSGPCSSPGCGRVTDLERWEAAPRARLQRVSAHPVGELVRLRALLVSHERRLGDLLAHPSEPAIADAAARAWAALIAAADDVSALVAAMEASR